ncbi:hypothetical protein F5Y11DRAFT_348882 [Daldinia sp. FL1419]|nr:hypothetical protein F5Y11DRAFT_348882 [Daldinia sp. FL1419]
MSGPDLSLPPKPPVSDFDTTFGLGFSQTSFTPYPTQQLSQWGSGARLNPQDSTYHLPQMPFPTPQTYAPSQSPCYWSQQPFNFAPSQSLPSPSTHQTGRTAPWARPQKSSYGPGIQQQQRGNWVQRSVLRRRSPTYRPSRLSSRSGPYVRGQSPPRGANQRYVSTTSSHFHNPNPLRLFFHSWQEKGVNILMDEEQDWICKYIDPEMEDQRDVVYGLARQVLWSNRSPLLTYKLLDWIQTRDNNYKITAKLLSERLNMLDPEGECTMMSLYEVDELMSCQFAFEACKEELKEKEVEKENESSS